MTEKDETRQLNDKQSNAISLLVVGKTDTETAEAVGVARQTVNGWRHHNAEFVAELNYRRHELWYAQTELLRGLIGDAVAVLADDMKSENKRLRQAAAVHVLKAVGRYGKSLLPHGATDAEKVRADWEAEETMEFLITGGKPKVVIEDKSDAEILELLQSFV